MAHHDRSRLEPNGCEDPSSRAEMLYLLVLTKKFGGSCLHLQGINGDHAVDEHTL
jgi:hypothetical protein